MTSEFKYRGIVEGFYGAPWSHIDRLWMLERMGAWGMNRYVYAPKDDPLHRERWREPYPDAARAEFRELVEHGAQNAVRVGFALSPGLSICYASKTDREALCSKLRSFVDWGASLLVLAVDDVPARLVHELDRSSHASLAQAHVDLMGALTDALGSEIDLWLVPTEYLGVAGSPYLDELGRGLPADVEVGWTGRTVLSPTVRSDEARLRATQLCRRPWLWDNLPAADGPMRHMLHLAPYLGREASLAEHVCGVLLNPMQQARASAVTLYTASVYLRDPHAYDPEAAWEQALAALGGGAREPLRTFARAHRFAPQNSGDRDRELESDFARLCDELEGGGVPTSALAALRARVEQRAPVADEIRRALEDRRLASELEPWLASHQAETQRMQIALEGLATLLDEAASAADRMLAYLRMEARLTRLPALASVSYGPRRVLYPQLRSMRDHDMGLGSDPHLLRDRCLADEIVDFVADLALWMLADDGAETPA